jgi:hypothetical protein
MSDRDLKFVYLFCRIDTKDINIGIIFLAEILTAHEKFLPCEYDPWNYFTSNFIPAGQISHMTYFNVTHESYPL